MKRYNSFGFYMKNKFGGRVYKVNVDAGFTCPNRDGTLGVSGCIYCNNDSFRPSSCKPTLSVSEQIRSGMKHIRKRYKAEKFLVYFQPYTNTYAPRAELEAIYGEALDAPDVIGLAIGTRPDSVDEDKISMLASLAKQHFILVEYGLQSIYDKSLAFINRGHDYSTFLRAMDLTKDRGIFIGAHLIAGFPTETRDEMLAMAEEISYLPVQFLKIHQLQVVKDTPLAEIFSVHPFHTFGYDEYLNFVVDFLERTAPHVIFQRLFATAPDDILVAPGWDRSRHRILNDVEKTMEARDTYQGRLFRVQSVRG
jgi:radical SAM protein (TIGR01212 family)